jgi:hypothetical protein
MQLSQDQDRQPLSPWNQSGPLSAVGLPVWKTCPESEKRVAFGFVVR